MHQGYIDSNLFSNIYYIPKVLRDWIVVILTELREINTKFKKGMKVMS